MSTPAIDTAGEAPRSEGPTPVELLESGAHAAVGIVAARLELAWLELRRELERAARAVAWGTAAALCAAIAWIAASAALALALGRVLPTDASVGVVAGLHSIAALACLGVARRSQRRDA